MSLRRDLSKSHRAATGANREAIAGREGKRSQIVRKKNSGERSYGRFKIG